MKLTGYAAIETAEALGLTLNKHTDPTEDAREGLTPAEARKVALEDPNLIWLEVQHHYDRDALEDELTGLFEKAIAGELSPACYIARIRPDGAVDIDREAGWCVSEAEYNKSVPHTLSLRIDPSRLNFSQVEDPDDFDPREEAERLAEDWAAEIREWQLAGAAAEANA